MKGQAISPKFRERIMLAVTEVNGCRYCSWLHTKMALKSGLQKDEIRNLLQGNLQAADPTEYPALLFATHWADTNKKPDAEMLAEFKKHYSQPEIQCINTLLQIIWWGNLCGNTLDHLLHRLRLHKN